WNEDDMVTPVQLKANIVVDLRACYAAGLFDDYRSVEMSDQMVSPVQEKVAADDDIVADDDDIVADDDSLLWRESASVIFDNCHNAEEVYITFL
ncbi:hypothetical protein A2U01_0013051, partial [Trifolium medium]|nr:hypothetical protein [Trifolium medium]